MVANIIKQSKNNTYPAMVERLGEKTLITILLHATALISSQGSIGHFQAIVQAFYLSAANGTSAAPVLLFASSWRTTAQ
jgi:hypothetical protein